MEASPSCCRRSGLNQRAVHGEALVAHKSLGAKVYFRKKMPRHVRGQQPVAVLGKHRVIPHRIVHAQACEPA